MIRVAGGFEYRDLYVYPLQEGGSAPRPAGGKQTFNYLPLKPQPETDAQGRPTLTFIVVGQGGFLQMGARLAVLEQTVQALRGELASRLQLQDAGLVLLNPAPLQVKSASLAVGDGAGNFTELSRSETSGFPPYTALFSVQIGAGRREAVTAALNGREGFLRVSYAVTLEDSVAQQLELAVDVAGWLGGKGTEHLLISPQSTSRPQ